MRVAIITDSLELGPKSVANYTRELIKAILDVSSINLVLVHCLRGDDPIYKHRRVTEILLCPTINLKSPFSKIYKFLQYPFKLVETLNEERLDLVHIPHVGRSAPPLAFLLFKGKLVATNHGMANLALPSSLCYGRNALNVSALRDSIELLKWRYSFRNEVDLIITVSESEKRNIIEKLGIPEDKVRVIYHGVSDMFKPIKDLEAARLKLERKYGVRPPFIFHVSSYQPKKNVEGLIWAYAYAKKKYDIRHKLVIGGKQPRHLVELARKLGVLRDVIFVGFIPDDDLPLFYNAADVFVFPSFHESFGMPILEAMACGTPVITSNVYAMPEIAGDAAILINPFNLKELAKAIYLVLVNESLRSELRRKGFKKARMFSWKKAAEEHLRVYREVVKYA